MMSSHLESEDALTDGLTGLPNRRRFSAVVREQVERSVTSGKFLSLVLLDVDGLGHVNETHGHQLGDAALKRVAELLRGNVKSGDMVLRLVGDEFAMILENVDSTIALRIAQRVADAVSALPIEVGGRSLPLTVSAGAATCPQDGRDVAALVKSAELALGARKRRGGNGACSVGDALMDRNVLRADSCQEFIGRRKELARFENSLGRAFQGEGSVILIGGEAGVGKTRFLAEAGLIARGRGALVLTGRCFCEPAALPYQPFEDILSSIGAAGGTEMEKAFAWMTPELKRELNHLAPLSGTECGTSRSSEPGPGVFEAFLGLISGISRTRPTVLLLEDLHLAGDTSVRLMSHLARGLRQSAILVCGSYRTMGTDEQRGQAVPLESAIVSAIGDGTADLLELGRLSHPETERMTGLVLGVTEVPEGFSHWVFRQTAGNPFLTQAILQCLVKRGKLRTSGDLRTVRPQGFETACGMPEAVQRNLEMLNPLARKVLGAVSAAGGRFSTLILLGTSGLNEAHLLDLLEEALALGLIAEEGNEAYRFAHAEVVQALRQASC